MPMNDIEPLNNNNSMNAKYFIALIKFRRIWWMSGGNQTNGSGLRSGSVSAGAWAATVKVYGSFAYGLSLPRKM